jgi:hypothetical protein
LILALAGATAQGADPCSGKVIASILSYDRDARQGIGLLVNQCGRPVAAEVLVMANNRDGFVVAKLRTNVHASAAPLSVIRIDLPFVSRWSRFRAMRSRWRPPRRRCGARADAR